MVYFNIMMVVYYKTCFSWTNKKGSGQGLTIYIWQPNSGKPDTFLFCKEEGSSGQDEEPVSHPVVAEATWNTNFFHKVTWISGCDSLLQSNCGANTQLMRQEIRAYGHNRKVCGTSFAFSYSVRPDVWIFQPKTTPSLRASRANRKVLVVSTVNYFPWVYVFFFSPLAACQGQYQSSTKKKRRL